MNKHTNSFIVLFILFKFLVSNTSYMIYVENSTKQFSFMIITICSLFFCFSIQISKYFNAVYELYLQITITKNVNLENCKIFS
jgi:hypothetical protein